LNVDVINRFGVLIAAHGGRDTGGHSNEAIFALADNVAALLGDVRVGVGFINGSPALDAAIELLAAPNIIVYPLFMAEGYFGSMVLNRALAGAGRMRQDGSMTILPPLGLDPALADLVVAEAASAVTLQGMLVDQVTLVLLAHGSRHSRNSASAAAQAATKARAHRLFADVCVSFLDEPPSLERAVSKISGPVAVVGLFSGEGLHGGHDAMQLMAQLERKDVIYVGNVGSFPGLEKLIATAVDNGIADQPIAM
jgi:sirohydrochlorin cobaltochelatase